MRRIILFLVTLISTANLFGADPLKVKSGNINVFNEKGTALVKFVYKSTEINGSPKDEYIESKGGDKYEEKWNKWIKQAEKIFVEDFNKYSKGLQLTRSKKVSVKYTVTINVKAIETGNTIKGFMPSMSLKSSSKGAAMMNASVTVKDKKNQNICVLELRNIYGSGGLNNASRIMTLYMEADKKIRKASKKIVTDDDEEEEEVDEIKNTKRKTAVSNDEEDDDEDIDEEDEDD